jgi:hypothetical protein
LFVLLCSLVQSCGPQVVPELSTLASPPSPSTLYVVNIS